MGWSFRCDPSFGRKQQIEEVIDEAEFRKRAGDK